MQDYEEFIKEENSTLKEEYKIKDPNTKIWKIRTSVQGSKHKAPEPMCIRHPDTGELVARPKDLKKVFLEHIFKIDLKIKN